MLLEVLDAESFRNYRSIFAANIPTRSSRQMRSGFAGFFSTYSEQTQLGINVRFSLIASLIQLNNERVLASLRQELCYQRTVIILISGHRAIQSIVVDFDRLIIVSLD